MLRRLTDRLSYANVMATIAVFVALGGSGYAAIHLPRNSVGAAQLRRHAVTNSKIAAHAVTASRVRPGSLTGAQILANSLTGQEINEATLGKVPSAASADVAGSANTVGGVTAGQLKVGCPSDTLRFLDTCIETTQRPAKDWLAAERACAQARRVLPRATQEDAYLDEFRSAAGGGNEWTGDVTGAGAIVTIGQGGFGVVPLTGSEPFRCVTGPTN